MPRRVQGCCPGLLWLADSRRTFPSWFFGFWPGFSPEAANFLLLLPRAIAKGTLVLIIVLDGIEVLKSIFQEISGKPHP